MDFYKACASMAKGIAVQSLVSKTIYEMSNKGLLLAEGIEVPITYLTVEEANGEWQEVTVIEKMEDFMNLSEDEVERILKEGLEHYEFEKKVRSKQEGFKHECI